MHKLTKEIIKFNLLKKAKTQVSLCCEKFQNSYVFSSLSGKQRCMFLCIYIFEDLKPFLITFK